MKTETSNTPRTPIGPDQWKKNMERMISEGCWFHEEELLRDAPPKGEAFRYTAEKVQKIEEFIKLFDGKISSVFQCVEHDFIGEKPLNVIRLIEDIKDARKKD